jgi:hypothetical protein
MEKIYAHSPVWTNPSDGSAKSAAAPLKQNSALNPIKRTLEHSSDKTRRPNTCMGSGARGNEAYSVSLVKQVGQTADWTVQVV